MRKTGGWNATSTASGLRLFEIMKTKLSKLKELMATGDFRAALKLAASFSQLGSQKIQIRRGWQAIQSPDFYREIGKNPDELVAAGVAAIRERYNL